MFAQRPGAAQPPPLCLRAEALRDRLVDEFIEVMVSLIYERRPVLGWGGGVTRRVRLSERFLFDMEKSFGQVKSRGLFLVTYRLIQRVVGRPVRVCFAAPRCWEPTPLDTVSFHSRGRGADFTSLQCSELD